MKRFNDMNKTLKLALLGSALTLAAGPASAEVYNLCAEQTTKTMPDDSIVPMWGYILDTDDIEPGCQGTIEIPGPRLTVTNGTLTINLENNLPEPTSIVIPGLPMPTPLGPTWNDGSTGARTDATQRVRSFGAEAASGGTESYSFTVDRPGTFIYHSGTHPQKQVYMGLYGAVTRDEVAEDIVTGTSAEAYPGVPYDNEVILFYSDIDPVLNKSIAKLYNPDNPDYADVDAYTTSIHQKPTWFLVNGEPYVDGVTADISAGLASDPENDTHSRSDTLIRFLSAAGEIHVPVLQGLRMTIHAEDGLVYNYQNGDTLAGTAPRSQYSAMLPPLKTKDAIIKPTSAGRYAVYDGNGYMTNPSDIDDFGVGDTVGGMLRFLAVGDANLLPIAVNDEAVTNEDTAVLIDVLANDLDPDNEPPSNLGLSIVSVTDPANGTAEITSDTCCVTYTPNANFNGTDQFDYTITDGNGVTSTATAFVQVTVIAVNDPPVITSDPVTTATTGVLYEYQVVAVDPDVPPDVLTFSLTVGPVGMSIVPESGLISWTPTVQDNEPSYDVTVVVTDLAGAIDTQAYTIDNTLVNVAPTITSTPVTTATVDQAYSYDVDATDPDLGDTQTWSLDVLPAGMSIDAASGVITWTPTELQVGDHAVTVRVTDFNGLFVTQSYTINVTPVNNPPMITSTPVTTAIVDQPYTYTVTAEDPDVGDILTWSLDISPEGMSIDAASGVITWTPTDQQLGDNPVTVTVTDSTELTDSQSYTVTVDEAAGPVFSVFFSTFQGVEVPDVASPYNNADIYAHDGAAYSRILAFVDTMGFNANVDALHMVDADTFYISFSNTTVNIPDFQVVQDEDVVLYDAGTWSMYFVGATCGLNANNGQDIDAISIEGGTLSFSTLGGGNNNPVGGVTRPYDDADVYTYSGGGNSSCGRALDASAVGLPGNADIDGLTVQGGTYYMSFNRDAGTDVPGLGSVADTAVVSYSGGPWTVYFSGPGLTGGTGQDLDAVHVPPQVVQ